RRVPTAQSCLSRLSPSRPSPLAQADVRSHPDPGCPPGPALASPPGGVIVRPGIARAGRPSSGVRDHSGAMTSGNRLESSFSYSDWMLPGPRGAQRVQPNVVLAVLSLAALTYAILSSAIIPALPTIQHSLHASETGITWLLTG